MSNAPPSSVYDVRSQMTISHQCAELAQMFAQNGDYVRCILWANAAQVTKNAEDYEPKQTPPKGQ